jgi:hypothetical protein
MTVEAIPAMQIESRQRGMNWRSYPNGVNKPAARIFGYALTGSFGLFETVVFLFLWSRNSTLYDAVYWFFIAVFAALAVGGLIGVTVFMELHNDYIELSQTQNERTHTDYRTVKAQPVATIRPTVTTQTSASSQQTLVGNIRFTPYQLRRLAATVANGGTFSHAALMDARMIGDRTTPGNAQKARDIQAELIRLGYAYTHGKATVASEAGRAFLAERFWLSTRPTLTSKTVC